MALGDILLGNATMNNKKRSSRNGRVMRESRGDLVAPTNLTTDPNGPDPVPPEALNENNLEDTLADMPAVPEGDVSSNADLDQQAVISAGQQGNDETATTTEGGATISAGQGPPPEEAVISAGQEGVDEVATTRKGEGTTISAGQGRPPIEDPEAAGTKSMGTRSIEEVLAGVEAPTGRSGGQEGGGFGSTLVDILQRPDVQKALTTFGQAAAGGDSEAVNTISRFGRQQAEAGAREALRRRLEQGESIESAIQADDVQGISPQGRQQVINDFQEQNLAEREQDQAERELDQSERRLDQREREFELRKEIQRGELEIAEDREERLRQGQVFDQVMQEREMNLEEQRLRMEQEMQEVVKNLRESEVDLNEAQMEDLRSGDRLQDLSRITATATERVSQIDQNLQTAEKLRDSTVESLPTDTAWVGSGTNVRAKAQALLDQVGTEGFSMQDVNLADQGIPEQYRADVKQALRKQQTVSNLQQERQQYAQMAEAAQNQVLSTFAQGAQGTGQASGGNGQQAEEGQQEQQDAGTQPEGDVVQVESAEEARSLPAGTRFKLPDGRTGTVQGG